MGECIETMSKAFDNDKLCVVAMLLQLFGVGDTFIS